MADEVGGFDRWDPAARRRTALATAALLLLLGACGLVLGRGGPATGVVAGGVAVLLGALAVALDRVRHDPTAGVGAAWAATGYAAVAGPRLVDAPGPAAPLVSAGGGAVLVALGCLVGLPGRRPLLVPAVALGTGLLATGSAAATTDVDPATAATGVLVLLVLVVLAGSALPSLALGLTGATTVGPAAAVGAAPEARPVDLTRVAAAARTAQDVLVAASASSGLLLVAAAPVAVSRGVPGALLATACCAVVGLRTRRHRARTAVLVGLVPAVLGLTATAATALWLHPAWRPAVATTAAAGGLLVLAILVRPQALPVRRGRLTDLAERVALLSLPPLLLLASDLLDGDLLDAVRYRP
jgi:hypothetical protein